MTSNIEVQGQSNTDDAIIQQLYEINYFENLDYISIESRAKTRCGIFLKKKACLIAIRLLSLLVFIVFLANFFIVKY